jgi:hypothetical protein
MNDLSAALAGKSKAPFLSAETLHLAFMNRLPDRYQVGRRRTRSKSKHIHPGAPDITSLQTSFNLWDGIRDLQKHNWRTTDWQYVSLAGLILFSFYVAPEAPALKFFGFMGGLWLLLMPATRQFFKPSLPIWTWLIYFFCSR